MEIRKFQIKPNHIYHFSGGSAAQHKNINDFISLCFDEKDFDITAEWHFYAKSHGKAGIVRRLPAHTIFQRPYCLQ
jgi:hypothetical protein